MRKWGAVELARRGAALALISLGLATFPSVGAAIAFALGVGGLTVYVIAPRERPPGSALTYEQLPAVIGPDLLGLLLSAFFIALPFWARMGSEELWGLVHPAAFLTWPLAVISLIILFAAARYASMWIVIEEKGLRVASMAGERFIVFADIVRVDPYRRGLPGWMKVLAPLLALSGHYTAGGAIMLARDASGVILRLHDGTSTQIAADAFERPLKQILKAIAANGIPIDPQLQSLTRTRKKRNVKA